MEFLSDQLKEYLSKLVQSKIGKNIQSMQPVQLSVVNGSPAMPLRSNVYYFVKPILTTRNIAPVLGFVQTTYYDLSLTTLTGVEVIHGAVLYDGTGASMAYLNLNSQEYFLIDSVSTYNAGLPPGSLVLIGWQLNVA